jgi:hypothetical protein
MTRSSHSTSGNIINTSIDYRELSDRLKVRIDQLSAELNQATIWNYSCSPDAEAIIRKSYDLLEVLDSERLRLKFNSDPCLNDREAVMLKTLVFNLAPACSPIKYPRSEANDFWKTEHPDCVPTDKWERYCQEVFCDVQLVGFTVQSVKRMCEMDVSIVLREVSCEAAAAVFAVQKNCDVDYNVNISREDCEVTYELFTKEHTCELSLGEFTRSLEETLNCKVSG